MAEEKKCAICGDIIDEEDEDQEYQELDDGRIVCESCYEFSTKECDECGRRFPEDELEPWGDDMRLCPECFKEIFPDFDEEENREETKDAYEAMKARYIGRKLEDWEELDIRTEMDDDSFSYSICIDIDDDNVITDISPLTCERCQWIGITRESWLPYPISASDYEEGGTADDIIESYVTFAEE